MFSPKQTTVAQVMSDFQKKVEALEFVVAEQSREAARQAQVIEDARAAMNAATKEADHAKEVISNLKAAYTPSKAMTATDLRAACAPLSI